MNDKPIMWREPPVSDRIQWKPIVQACKENPGKWAFVGRTNYSSGYQYARKFGLEVRVANRDGSRGDVYLRHKG